MRLQICEIENDLKHLDEETIIKGINSNNVISEWAYILHDKDTKEDGTPINDHWHVFLRLSEGREIGQIAKWFGIKENQVQACKSKSQKAFRFDDMLSYTIHAGNPDKYQYDLSDVKTNISDLPERIEEYKKRKAGEPVKLKKTLEEQKELQNIINQITEGKIREFNLTDFVDGVLYTKHTREIKAAFEYRRQILQQMDREMEVYFFCGDSGSGKTSYAKQIARDKGLSFFVSSSQNDVLDGYAGQDIIILDDLRPKSFELADLLKFLDNNTNSTVKSRYHNKVIEAKIVIITSIYSLKDFFNRTGQDAFGDEPITQFKRRCNLYAVFTDRRIETFVYNPVKEDYDELASFRNPIRKKFPKLEPDEELKQRYRDLFTVEIIQEDDENTTENLDEVAILSEQEAIDKLFSLE